MVRLGFIEYVEAIKRLGYGPLFPDLFSDKTNNDPGDRFYDTFVPIMQEALGERCGTGRSMRSATAWQIH